MAGPSAELTESISCACGLQQIAIHHYATKSKEEFRDKVERGPAHGTIGKSWHFFDAVNAMSTDTCLDGIR